jgi:hypothetical protein
MLGALASGAEGLAVAFGLTAAVMFAAVGALSFTFQSCGKGGFFVLGRINILRLLLYWTGVGLEP